MKLLGDTLLKRWFELEKMVNAKGISKIYCFLALNGLSDGQDDIAVNLPNGPLSEDLFAIYRGYCVGCLSDASLRLRSFIGVVSKSHIEKKSDSISKILPYFLNVAGKEMVGKKKGWFVVLFSYGEEISSEDYADIEKWTEKTARSLNDNTPTGYL